MVCHSNITFGASLLALTLIYAATLTVKVQAQVAGGAISGMISDTRGRAITGAQVSITKVAGVSRTTATNEDDTGSADPAWILELKISDPGFRMEVLGYRLENLILGH
jgi:hypothetical protein